MTDWFGLLLTTLWLKDLSLSFSLSHCLTVSQHTAQHGLCTCRVWQQLYFDNIDILQGFIPTDSNFILLLVHFILVIFFFFLFFFVAGVEGWRGLGCEICDKHKCKTICLISCSDCVF